MDRHESGLRRVAQFLIPEGHGAAELVEQTWLQLVSELERFDGAAPLKVWLHAKLLHVIRAHYPEVARALDEGATAPCGPAVAAERFSPPGDRWDGHWRSPPQAWSGTQLAALPSVVESGLRALPIVQRAITLLHDSEGIAIPHVSQLLQMDEARCKQHLHAARSQLWAASERQLAAREEA